jgi:hypothetical protein
VRPSALINEEIRALWFRAGGVLASEAERVAYAELVVEWAAAVRVEGAVVEAA